MKRKKKISQSKSSKTSAHHKKQKKEKKEQSGVSKQMIAHIDKSIVEIYQNKDGSLPDMAHFEKRKGFRLLGAIASLVLAIGLLGGVVYAGWFIYQAPGAFLEEDVIISVSGEEEVVSGSDVQYRIRYRNAQETALLRPVIEVRYPRGFLFSESSLAPANEANNRWELPTLMPGDSGYIDVFGSLFGSNEEEQSFRVFMNYTPENFSSEFQKVSAHRVKTLGADIDIAVDAPENVVPGVTFPLTVRLTTPTGTTHGHLALRLKETGKYLLKTSVPAADQFQIGRWSLDPATSSHTIVIDGVVSATEDMREIEIPFEVVGWANEQRSGDGYVYKDQVHTVALLDAAVQLTPVVNGATHALTVQPGEPLQFSVSVQNHGEQPIRNLRLRSVFDMPSLRGRSILDWTKLEDERDGTIIGEQLNEHMRRGILVWSYIEEPTLSVLGPDERVTIDIRIPLKNAEDVTLSDFQSFQGHIAAELQYELNGQQEILSTDAIDLTINSDLALNITDDISETRTPEDTHTVVWSLSNSFHALERIEVTAEYYGDTTLVTSTMSVPAGAVEVNEEEQKLTWNIAQMPVELDVLPLQFTLIRDDVNPSQTQLMSRVQLRALDTVTGEEIVVVGNEIGL